MHFNTSSIEPRENYQLLSGGVTPRPIAWISTRSKAGIDNLAPFSFFTVASCNPPVLLYTQINPRSGLDKDTLANLVETKECVVNVVTSANVNAANASSAGLPPEESEFDFANISSTQSQTVSPLSVDAAPVRYECTLRDIVTVSDLPTGGKMVLLDVKSVYVADELMVNGRIDQERLDTVGKSGGDYFSMSPEQVLLARPE